MPNLKQLLKSSPLPRVEDVVGYVLEELAKQGTDHNIGNFAASLTGTPPGSGRDMAQSVVFEAFQWLQSRDMIAPSAQPGWYFVTQKGREIGTAAKLKVYLEEQQANTATAYERVVNDLAKMRLQAKSDIDKAIEDAKKEAQAILNQARATAQGVSLEDAQKQFKEAAQKCLTGVRIWASLSGILIVLFVIVVMGFFTWWEPSFLTATQTTVNQAPASEKGMASGFVIYHTVLRITLLTAIGAIATFCLKMLRARLHLREQNLHRQRVINSMSAFLGAASPDQRDVVLGRMVDAVIAFGNSGLLSDNDESMSPAKVILESVPRALTQK